VRFHEHAAGAGLAAPATHPFDDIRGTALEDRIAAAWDAGLVRGVSADTYHPSGDVSRAQAASTLVRLLDALLQERPHD
jgi:hypothetical protein